MRVMLKVLRNQKTKRNIFIGLAVVIIPPFLLWGTMFGKNDGSMPTGAIARYHGKTISIQDYLKSYKAAQHQLMLQFGKLYDQVGKMIDVKGEAFDRILLADYAKTHKITAS